MKCKFEQFILKVFSYASEVENGRLREVIVDDRFKSGRILEQFARLDSDLPQNGQFRSIMDGLLSQSFLTESGRSESN